MATKVADVLKARVKIDLNGKEVTLIPSPGAIVNLSAQYSGFNPLLVALGRMDVQAAANIVVAGLSLDGPQAKRMVLTVAEAGVLDLIAPLTRFVMILANGGRPLPDDDTDEKKGDEDGDPNE